MAQNYVTIDASGHKAGEKLFVDYCGPTVDWTDPTPADDPAL